MPRLSVNFDITTHQIELITNKVRDVLTITNIQLSQSDASKLAELINLPDRLVRGSNLPAELTIRVMEKN